MEFPGFSGGNSKNVLMAKQHETRATFALAMQSVVLPLTVLTLVIVRVRAWRKPGRA